MPAATALSRRYSAASGISDVSAKDVISQAAAGDAIADRIFQDAIEALGRAPGELRATHGSRN